MTVYRVEPWIAHVVKTSNAGRQRKPDCSRIWGFFSFPLCTQQTYSGCAPDVRKRKLQKKNEGKKVSKISRQFFFSFLLEQVKSECARDRNGGGVSSHLYNRWSVKKYAGVPLKKKKKENTIVENRCSLQLRNVGNDHNNTTQTKRGATKDRPQETKKTVAPT